MELFYESVVRKKNASLIYLGQDLFIQWLLLTSCGDGLVQTYYFVCCKAIIRQQCCEKHLI